MQIEEKPQPLNLGFWETFTAAPHRMMFFAGAVQLLLPLLFWAIELFGRYTQLWAPLELLIPATWVHGFIMLYGVFIFFIFGFLFTVYPRWMNGPLVPKSSYISTFIWMCSGILLFELGVFFNLFIAVIGIAIFMFGWALGQWALFKVYRAAPAQNKNYETILNIALSTGWLSAGSFLLWLLTDDWSYQAFSLKAGIWIFLLPILFTVSHRMLPFFTSSMVKNYVIVQPRLTLIIMLSASVLHLILDVIQLPQWLFLADIPMAATAFYHTVKWGFTRSFVDRLLAVLHLAFIWLGIGMTLFSFQSLYLLISGELVLAKAPLHAITIGFFSTLLIAMASRVSLGHSGRLLILGSLSWTLFLGLQLTAVLRIMSDIAMINNLITVNLNLIAAVLWLLCITAWVMRYAPFYLTARVDNRPG